MLKIKSVIYDGIIVFLAVEIIMLFLYILGKYAPFGANSLACMDANIQYLDLFGYFKDVLEGKNNIYYSFGKTLGGNNIAVFSYYLASPLNLLILFFEKTQLHVFFNLLFMLKMGMAGAFFSIFLNSRFDKSDIEPEKKILIISFSICYAFSQYNIAQSSNIMWIDGVYMLPLILLGVYNVANNRKMWKLIIPVAFSILFNWYTAAINCLFSLLWIIMELVLTEQNDVRTKARAFVQYIFSIIIALMCSAVLFLPTVNVMKNSSRGDLQFGLLRDFSFKGDVLSIIQSYTYGARSTGEKVSLYCGVLALVIFLEFFFTDKNRKRKLAFTFIAAVNLLMFYWNPLYSVFSLLKNVASYWCRFSYLGIATLLFIAFYYLSEISSKEYTDIYKGGGVKYALILLILNYARRDENRKFVYYTAILIILVSFVLKKYILSTENKKYILVLLSVITIFDVTYNSYLLMKNYHTSDVNEYKEYVQEHEGMIRQIKNADNNIYRISQTFTRNMKTNNLTANYNEAINYGFWSISGYTSSPDEIQLKLLHKLGYRQNGLNMCIVNTSVLGADSFLGVKYILSDYPVNGLKPVSGSDKIYFNPYYLPLAFTYIDNQNEIESDINPFEFQNRIYSKLLGEKVEIYKKLDYEVVQEGDLSQNRESKYKIFLKEGENAVYGNIPWNSEMNAVLNVNGYYETDYSKWLSPSVFYIPVSDDDLEAELIIKANSSYDVKKDEEQFYALDLKLLEEISNRIRKNEANKLYVENGKIEAEVNGEAGANLILTVPYDKNWKIRLNGKRITANLFAGCFYSIPLEEGINTIEMTYLLPDKILSIILSVTGFGIAIYLMVRERDKYNEQ